MANELTYPMLPCRDLEESITFYEALGFRRTYRQLRPNPYAVMAREDLHIHLFAMVGFKPEDSYGSAIVVVPDTDGLYEAFAAGLRAAYGKLPIVGIPRILRPRKRFGTVRGFTVVDPGGNWLRISKAGDTEEEAKKHKSAGLALWIENAARQGDARGDDSQALEMLQTGIARFPQAPPIDRVRALAFRAELAVRVGDRELARSSLAEAGAVELTGEELEPVREELAHAAEIVAQLD